MSSSQQDQPPPEVPRVRLVLAADDQLRRRIASLTRTIAQLELEVSVLAGHLRQAQEALRDAERDRKRRVARIQELLKENARLRRESPRANDDTEGV